jgi:hypothetical protein
LAPHALALQHWTEAPWQDPEARTGLAACGDAGCMLLTPLYNDPAFEGYRGEIIKTWGEARYAPAADLLIELLKKYCATFRGKAAINGNIISEANGAMEALKMFKLDSHAKAIFTDAVQLMSINGGI